MKRSISITTVLLLTLSLLLSLSACGRGAEADLWAGALYTADTELGSGSKTLQLEVKAGEKSVLFTLHTDAESVCEALQENRLVEGEPGSYGFYIKKVNGITADYDTDQTYWAFYIGADYAMTGVEQTPVQEGVSYRLERSK